MFQSKAHFTKAYLEKFQSLHGKGVEEGSNRERYEALAGLVRGEHLSKEKIVEVDPDILMFSDYSSTQEGDSELFRKEVLDDPALQSIKAIKNKNIIIIKDRYRYAASQYIGDAICDIAQKTYPEYFDQINN